MIGTLLKLKRINLGENVVIAIIDTGIHPELSEQLGERVINPYNVIAKKLMQTTVVDMVQK